MTAQTVLAPPFVPQSTTDAPPTPQTPQTPILADDAADRPRPDFTQPMTALVGPALAALAGEPGGRAERVRALLRDLAERGLLDAGVDAAMAQAHGYAEGSAWDSGRPEHDHTRVAAALVAAVADVCGASAAAVAVQRAAIDVLARARRTPANERLLKALRRGAVVGALPAPGQAPLDGELLVDGSILVASGRLDLVGAGPGGAVLLPVRLGGRVVGAWTPYAAAGLVHDAAGTGTLIVDRLVIRADTVVDAPTGPAPTRGAEVPDGPLARLLSEPQAA